MRYTVTIPAAGEKTIVPLSGRSVIVEEMNVYPAAADVPTMNLISGISDYPLYPRSVYPNSQRFDQVEIIGTSESAGDEVKLLSTDQCLDLAINIQFSETQKTTAGQSKKIDVTDTAQSLNIGDLLSENGKVPTAIYIQAREFDVNYAFDVDPSAGESFFKLVADAEPLKIIGLDFIQKLRFINETSGGGADADLIVQPEY